MCDYECRRCGTAYPYSVACGSEWGAEDVCPTCTQELQAAQTTFAAECAAAAQRHDPCATCTGAIYCCDCEL